MSSQSDRGLDSRAQRMRSLQPVVPARANQGNAVRLFDRQCRGCPRNCKRRADDHLIPLGSVDPGKVVEGNDPRARKPAASHGLHARVGRGVPKRWKVRVDLPHWGEGRLSRPTCRRFGVRRWGYHRVKFCKRQAFCADFYARSLACVHLCRATLAAFKGDAVRSAGAAFFRCRHARHGANGHAAGQ